MDGLPEVGEMERAFLAKDASYDGVFYLAVRTTGIFCRPSCPARKPLPQNVSYFPSVKSALFAGYRPCKRCHPLELPGTQPEWVSQILDRLDEDPSARWSDADLQAAGVDPARLRRHFQKQYGMTFQAYCRGRRLGNALTAIRDGGALDEVILGYGYDSHSGFRDAFSKTFGKPPGQSRESDCIRLAWMESPIGPLVAGATETGICLLEFTDRRMLEAQFATLRSRFRLPLVPGSNGHLELLAQQLAEYFEGKRTRFTVPLDYPGTPFQRRVWEALLEIPCGETRSYGELARHLGLPGGARAVGHANGLNRIGIVIPCHRVIDASGGLGGYGGGVWRKRLLLDLEQGKPVPWRGTSEVGS